VIGVATFPYSTTAEATAAIPILYNSRSNCSHSHTLQQQKQLQPFPYSTTAEATAAIPQNALS